MRWHFDKTGFPLLMLDELKLGVSLLPCTKLQFERFLSESVTGFGNAWYEEVTKLNPRVSWRHFEPSEPERFFLTGIFPEEALVFTRWLGVGNDLPTVEEWRAIDRLIMDRVLDPLSVQEVLADCSQEAQSLIGAFHQRLLSPTWGSLMQMRGGVFEWVHEKSSFVALGKTRPAFWAATLEPQKEVFHPNPNIGRRRHVGFRTVLRCSAGL